MVTHESPTRLYSNDNAPLLEEMEEGISPVEEGDSDILSEVAINSGIPPDACGSLNEIPLGSEPGLTIGSDADVESTSELPIETETQGNEATDGTADQLFPEIPAEQQPEMVPAITATKSEPVSYSKWELLKKSIRSEVEFYKKRSWVKKIIYWLEAPLTFLRNATIPVVMEERYDKFLLLLTAFGMPLFIFYKTGRGLTDVIMGLPCWSIILICSFLLFLFFACCMPFQGTPKKGMFLVSVSVRCYVDYFVHIVLHVDHVGGGDC